MKEADAWTELTFHKKDTIHSEQIYEKLYFDDISNVNKVNFLSPLEYFNLLFSSINRETLTEKFNEKQSGKVVPFKELIRMSFANKIEYIFKKIHILTYRKLLSLLKDLDSGNLDKKELLETALRYSRFLKNGNLILKTELRYDDLRNDIALKRNYLINLLQNNPEGVNKTDIRFLDKKELDVMLGEFAYSAGGKVYLKENNIDTDAINEFKAYYERDVQYWESINIKKGQPTNTVNLLNNEVKQNKANINVFKEIIDKVFLRNDVVPYNDLLTVIKKEINYTGPNTEADKTITDAINKNCFVINNTCYLRDVGDESTNLLRKKLFEFFGKNKTAKKGQIKDFISTEGVTVTESVLNRVLKSLAVSDKNIYTLKQEN
jgi:hypothetical protein